MSVQGEVARPTRLGRYELITRIGQGGMAEVQLALQRGPAGFEKLVVVKLVHDNLATQKAFVDMLLDEARVAALVKHPNVVDIYDLGQADGRYFIAMEYLEGEPLLAVLRAGREGKRLDALSTGRLIADTAEGLDAAHELRSMSGERIELVHHDISLGNIVVLYNGQVKLVDFGVAKATQSAPSKSKVQGKFSYMAPEKLRGAPGDRRSDIFSLGCVMWEALTLKRLFRGGSDGETMRQVLDMAIQPPSKVNPDVPAEYDPIVLRALDRDPARRQLTAKELAVEIEELLRKRGYGAKNDKVARYMQETFKDHIEARKKLVQEVVSKGSASAEILDAAFRDQELAQGSPLHPPVASGELSGKVARPAAPDGVPPARGSKAYDTGAATEVWRPDEVDVGGAEIGGATEIAPPPVFEPEPRPAATTEATLVRSRWSALRARARAVLADPRQRLLAIGSVAGAAVVVLGLALILRGGKGNADPGATAGEASGSVAGSDALAEVTAPPDAAPAVAPPIVAAGTAGPAAGSASGSAGAPDPEIEIDDPHQGSPRHHERVVHDEHDHVRPHPAAPPVDAEQLTQKGVQAYVKGDLHGALAVLLKARSAKPGYAPAWRVLGQVYERLGDHAQARNAFQRYLSLSPNAPDAAQIRQRLEKGS